MTWSEMFIKVTPTGMKIIPIIKNMDITTIGVRIGCQDGRRCCLKAVSTKTGKNQFTFDNHH